MESERSAYLRHTPPMGSARISSVRFDDLLCLYANVFWYFWPRDRLCTHGSKRGRKKEAVESCGNRQTRHWLSAWNRAGLRRHPFLTESTFGNQPANGGNYTTPTRCRLQAAASSSSSLLRTWIQSRSPKPSIVGSITLPLLLLGRAVQVPRFSSNNKCNLYPGTKYGCIYVICCQYD